MDVDTISGRYKVLSEVTPGTMLCENITTGVKWVLKKFPVKDREMINTLGFIRHPGLPRLVENIVTDDGILAVFEYIQGKTLQELCDHSGGKIDCIRACRYMKEIACALEFLHSNEPDPILHLDIKPANVIIQENDHACLIDFGSMNIDYSNNTANSPDIRTTISYAPMELLHGRPLSPSTDIYFIGVTLFELVVGTDNDFKTMITDKVSVRSVPAQLMSIIHKCTMHLPEDRYQKTSALVNDLDAFINEYEVCSLASTNMKINNAKIISVWGNAQFAAELAWNISSEYGNTLLVDADLLSPGIDKLIDIRKSKTENKFYSESRSVLGILMDEFSSGNLRGDSIDRISYGANKGKLKCICGDYRTEDYEHYSTEGLAAIIKASSSHFDHVIIACSKFIYDEFTCMAFICSHVVLIPLIANHINFREFMKYVEFLSARKQLDSDKAIYIGFEYRPDEDLGQGTCQEICDGKFGGVISFSSRRRMLAGTNKYYVENIEQKIKRQYAAILRKL
ncbi:MAG: protein kinase [Eubacteriales bacterium]|nr:protein kinase [Eubacteriales bacterium]MDD4327058.1 protein kinase [Eubacteriales bacterium]